MLANIRKSITILIDVFNRTAVGGTPITSKALVELLRQRDLAREALEHITHQGGNITRTTAEEALEQLTDECEI